MSEDILVLALGGNAIVGRSRSFQSQFEAVSSVAKDIARLVRKKGYRVVITHGNGPQVGDTLLRHESAKQLVPPLPLYACVAETQGLLGFMIQSSLSRYLGNDAVISMISIAYVSRNDPAFKKPSKPVGPIYTKDDLERVRKLNPSSIFRQIMPNRYRRLVASPDPVTISGSKAVKSLVEKGYTIITAGGGGIPAVRARGRTSFVDAVIDKDLASERLATSIGASKVVFLTDVEGAFLDYGGERQLLRNVTANEMRIYLKNGEFEQGSMEPKVRAAIRFVENTGNDARIGSLKKIDEILRERAGTNIQST